MNKYGFISGLITLTLLLFQFIPLGIYFGFVHDSLSSWLPLLFEINSNLIINSHVKISIELFTHETTTVYLWGITKEGTLHLWFFIDLITFAILFVGGAVSILLVFIGCAKENQGGKKLMKINFGILLVIFVYVNIGFMFFSEQIFGTQFDLLYVMFNIFHSQNYGFYLLIIDLILSIVAISKHPIQ